MCQAHNAEPAQWKHKKQGISLPPGDSIIGLLVSKNPLGGTMEEGNKTKGNEGDNQHGSHQLLHLLPWDWFTWAPTGRVTRSLSDTQR